MTREEQKRNAAAIREISKKQRQLRDKQQRNKRILLLLTVLIVLGLYIAVFVQLTEIDKQQTDTLNQIMELRQEVTAPETSVVGVELSAEDRLLVAKVCMAETSSYEGYLAVAQVIHNRAALWGQDVYDVVTADKQFATPVQGKASDEALAAVDAVFNGARAFTSNATHFHAEGTNPYWTADKEKVGTVGGNVFWI